MSRTIKDAAEELGITYAAVRGRRRRRTLGMEIIREGEQTVFDRVADMPPRQAVDYLLGVVAALYEAFGVEEVERLKGFSKAESRIISRLMRDPGQPVSHEAIYQSVYFDHGNPGGVDVVHTVRALICRARKRGAPIRPVHGYGYLIEKDWTP